MKYYRIKQHDITDCGAACLATISKQYGLSTSITKIRQIAGTGKQGTNAYGMVKAAGQLGFTAKAAKGNQEAFFSEFPLPAIAHVVVEGTLLHYEVIQMKQIKTILCCFAFLCLLLSGCAKQETSLWDAQALKDKNLLVTECDGVSYCFDVALWDEQAAEQAVENISAFLSACGALQEALSIYGGAEAEDAAFCLGGAMPTLEDYLALYRSVYGEAADPVMEAAAVTAICAEFKLCGVEGLHTDEELAAWFSDETKLYLLDLTLPMIENRFVSTEAAGYARSAAASIAAYCLREHGADAMRALVSSPVDAPEKTRLKNAWLQAIGAEANYQPLALLSFERNAGEEADIYPYVLTENSFRFYISRQDIWAKGYPAFISPYLDFRPLYELDFAEAREVLAGVITEDVSSVDIYTDFVHGIALRAAIYEVEAERILLYGGWDTAHQSLLHEYIHFLTRNIEYAPMVEGLTEAVSVFRCQNRTCRMQYALDEKLVERTRDSGLWDPESNSPDMKRMHTFAALNYYDKVFFNSDGVYLAIDQTRRRQIPDEVTINDLSYEAAASMAEYMFELYGIETVYACVSDYDKMEALWGKPFSEFYEDWRAWLLQRFIEDGGIVGNAA